MKIEVNKEGLKSMVRGNVPSYNDFDNDLVIKAGHSYSDQYGRTRWGNLDDLTEEELYLLCKDKK